MYIFVRSFHLLPVCLQWRERHRIRYGAWNPQWRLLVRILPPVRWRTSTWAGGRSSTPMFLGWGRDLRLSPLAMPRGMFIFRWLIFWSLHLFPYASLLMSGLNVLHNYILPFIFSVYIMKDDCPMLGPMLSYWVDPTLGRSSWGVSSLTSRPTPPFGWHLRRS